jgi:enoyl-CoA hydratase/carnithine racemase
MTALPAAVQSLAEPPADRILKTLRTYRQGRILTVELNAPEEGNVVGDALLDDLLTVLGDQDPEIRVLVLAAVGRDFSLGGDRKGFAQHVADDPNASGVRVWGTKGRLVCDALSSNPAVTIARVQGRAIGAGFGLALACDLRIGSETASFRLPEIALGLPLAWGGLLPRAVNELGTARVRELILTARIVDAAEAKELSILQKVVPSEELDAAVLAWAKPIARRSRTATRLTKALLGSLSAANRLGDISVFDPELMASAVAQAAHAGREG